jgi:hypothetical protein
MAITPINFFMLGQLESKGYSVAPRPLQAESDGFKNFLLAEKCWERKRADLIFAKAREALTVCQPSGRCFILVGDNAPFDLME